MSSYPVGGYYLLCIFHINLLPKIVLHVVSKSYKINEKEAGDGPLKKIAKVETFAFIISVYSKLKNWFQKVVCLKCGLNFALKERVREREGCMYVRGQALFSPTFIVKLKVSQINDKTDIKRAPSWLSINKCSILMTSQEY